MNWARTITAVVIVSALSACGGGNDEPTTRINPCLTDKLNPIDFGRITDAELDTAYFSNEVTISGLAQGCTESFSGDEKRSFSINGAAFSTGVATVRNGDRVRLRHVSASYYGSSSSWSVLNDSFYVSTRSGRAADAPVVTLLSPIDQSTVHASRIVVSGTATDPDGITHIEVTGSAPSAHKIIAVSDDGFATWSVEIALATGINVITVTTADELNNRNTAAAEISVNNLATVLEDPAAIETDIANLRLLVLDKSLRALLAINLVNGQHTVLSDENSPDAGNPFTDPARLVVDSSGSTAWVLDRAYDEIIEVELGTGKRTLITGAVGTGLAVPISNAIDLVLDEINNRLLLAIGEDSTTQIVSINLRSGEFTVLSDTTIPNSDNPFGAPKSLALDSIGNRLLVIQRNPSSQVYSGNAVLAVDPTTGLREVLVNDSVLTNNPVDSVVDIDNGRVIILTTLGIYYRAIVLTLDLASNELTTLISSHSSRSIQIARDPLNNRLLVIYDNSSSIGAIDLMTGDASVAY